VFVRALPGCGGCWGCSEPAVYTGWRRAKKFGERKGVEGGALHAGAELLGTLTLGLALDGSTEGVGHAETAVEGITPILYVHLVVGCRDVQTEVIAEEIVRIKSKAKLPLEERVG